MKLKTASTCLSVHPAPSLLFSPFALFPSLLSFPLWINKLALLRTIKEGESVLEEAVSLLVCSSFVMVSERRKGRRKDSAADRQRSVSL